MRSDIRCAFIAVLVLVAGCRQPDGPMPTPNAERQNEVNDVAQNLRNIATGRDPQALKDLADDLRKYVDERPAVASEVDELSRQTAAVLPGKKLTDQSAQQLAHNLWLSVMARELSERQVETLQNDVQSLLVSVGIAEENAQQVAAQVGDVQRAVTNRSRRWYELF